MVKDLWQVIKSIVGLADDLQRYHSEIRDIREDITRLTMIVHGLSQEIKHSKEQADKDRENLLLELENRLLKADRALPPAKKGGKK